MAETAMIYIYEIQNAPQDKLMKKFYLAFAGFSCMIILIVLVQLVHTYNDTYEKAKAITQTETALVEQAFLSSISTIDSTLSEISNEVADNPSLIYKYPTAELIKKKLILDSISTIEIRLTNEKGIITSSSSELNPKNPVNTSDRNYFKTLRDGPSDELVISEPVFGKIRHKWLFIVARKIINSKSKKFIGTTFVSVELDFLSNYKNLLNTNGDNFFAVIMGDPLKFAFRYPPVESGKPGDDFKYNPNLEPVVKNELHSVVAIQLSKVDSKKRMVSASRVGNYPIIIIIGKSTDLVFSSWYKHSLILSILALLLIVLAYIFGAKLIQFSKTILKQQEELVDSARFRALGELAGSIAHEVNNPMTIVSGNLRKIEKMIEKKDTDFITYTSTIEVAKNAVERVSKIISGLKKLSRNTAIESSVVNIYKIIDEALFYTNERINYSNIKLTVIHENPEANLYVDSVQVSQVLVNLINNSIDAIENLSEKWINITSSVKKTVVVIRVTDCGSGIDSVTAAKIMTPFYSTKGINKGTGLGLSISKRIIESYNGRIYYQIFKNNTSFVIELPLNQS